MGAGQRRGFQVRGTEIGAVPCQSCRKVVMLMTVWVSLLGAVVGLIANLLSLLHTLRKEQ